jgi:hypothetical protein
VQYPVLFNKSLPKNRPHPPMPGRGSASTFWSDLAGFGRINPQMGSRKVLQAGRSGRWVWEHGTGSRSPACHSRELAGRNACATSPPALSIQMSKIVINATVLSPCNNMSSIFEIFYFYPPSRRRIGSAGKMNTGPFHTITDIPSKTAKNQKRLVNSQARHL